jgi:hypothetical protein
MAAFVARPDGDGPFPVAVIYMDAVGWREQVRENARRFAAGGFHCLAPADSPHSEIAGVRGELYFAFAEIDRSVTPEMVDRFGAETKRAGVGHREAVRATSRPGRPPPDPATCRRVRYRSWRTCRVLTRSTPMVFSARSRRLSASSAFAVHKSRGGKSWLPEP